MQELNNELKLLLKTLQDFNEILGNVATVGKETVELLEAHITNLENHDERPHRPAPTDEEIDRMHDLWDSDRVESESKEYRNAH